MGSEMGRRDRGSTASGEGRHGSTSGARVPPFLTKLYTIMHEGSPHDYAGWCADGKAFRIIDPQRFADHCLPRFFKHNKLGSFQQQLLTYGSVSHTHLRLPPTPSRALPVRSGRSRQLRTARHAPRPIGSS